MSLRSRISGALIKRLAMVEAEDPARRAALYSQIREEFAGAGFEGSAPAEALPHLESAIAFQEVYWLRETGLTAEPCPVPAQPPPQKRPVTGKPWRWPQGLGDAGHPPGPAPGPADGPYSDHTYTLGWLETPSGRVTITIGWATDPACILNARAPDIGFEFTTRASDLNYALQHLDAFLAQGGLRLSEEMLNAAG